MKAKTTKVWGTNKSGQIIKEHSKLLCGNGLDTWHTHALINKDGSWHRETDYYHSKVIGEYEP